MEQLLREKGHWDNPLLPQWHSKKTTPDQEKKCYEENSDNLEIDDDDDEENEDDRHLSEEDLNEVFWLMKWIRLLQK